MSLLLWTYEGSNDERKSAQRTGDSTYTQGTPFMTTRGAPLRSEWPLQMVDGADLCVAAALV